MRCQVSFGDLVTPLSGGRAEPSGNAIQSGCSVALAAGGAARPSAAARGGTAAGAGAAWGTAAVGGVPVGVAGAGPGSRHSSQAARASARAPTTARSLAIRPASRRSTRERQSRGAYAPVRTRQPGDRMVGGLPVGAGPAPGYDF